LNSKDVFRLGGSMMDDARAAVQHTLARAKAFLAQEAPPRLSEADTKANFIEPVVAALGWEGIGVVTREYYVRNSQEFIDYVMVGPNGPLLAIEAKPLQSDLTDKHAAQLIQYCAVDGIEWAALTNGRELQFFNTFLKPDLAAKRVLRLDLLAWNSDEEFAPLFSQVWQLSRQSMTTPTGVRTWLHQRRLDAAIRALLLDPASPSVRQLRKSLADAEIAATPQDIVQWFRTHLGATMAAIGPALAGTWQPKSPNSTSASTARTTPKLGPTRPVTPSRESEATGERHILTPLRDNETGTARETLNRLLGAGWYVFGERTPTRKALAVGDRLCFYEVGVGIVAEAVVASTPERRALPEARQPERYPWAFRVTDVRFFFDAPIAVDAGLRARLDAFQNKDASGPWAWFVQGTHTVTRHDFALLTGRELAKSNEVAANA
jgi:hypothetical protein